MEYDVIIGMEIHAELKTKSKMFCRCENLAHHSLGEGGNARGAILRQGFGRQAEPNTKTCPICLGHPGTLPYPNRQAIEWTILLGLGLHCQINEFSKFDRKNYFYPDLPKGYQISQFEIPFCSGGYLDIDGEKVAITRIHLEEDTGKSMHPAGRDYSLVDLNRAGTPLIELVTEPVIRSAEIAKRFCQRYQQVLRYLDISSADMEQGEMRCEANVSIQEKGKWKYEDGLILPIGNYKLNPKVELKNINSFRAVEKAILYEIERQKKILEESPLERGGSSDSESRGVLRQETRGWNESTGKTVHQRYKETSADYRYFPEPDIPPLKFTGKMIEEIKAKLIELPSEKKVRFINEYGFDDTTAEILVTDKDLADYAEEVVSELEAWIVSTGDTWERQKNKLSKLTANWLISELFKHLNTNNQTIRDIKITPENFAELMTLVYQDKVNSSATQKIMEVMYAKGSDPTDVMYELGLEQMDDAAELEAIVNSILAGNPDQVAQYKAGKTNVAQFLVGRVMAETKGKANPKKVQEILLKSLS
ncbi:MAG TPA: Asp-tRNA(Asn)/Glu-tRNA(Gln) amidotransferase subunit GatB [Candidatus Nanoarchaeia archaeon]|nr:Asp-tRNA(Asn)/Glu-tRNA(Gln) amidotransferase subunit GatB [Candidatus Nanoarchaeia archaeon]